MEDMDSFDPQRVLEGVVSLNPASIAGGAVGTVTATIQGLTTDMRVIAMPQDQLEAGLVPRGARVSAANTLLVELYNPTGGAIDGAAKNWVYLAWKKRT